MTTTADTRHLCQALYAVLVAVVMGQATGRILSTQRVYEPGLHREEGKAGDRRSKWPATRPAAMPTFSSNDRSRWATVRALVDEGTFVIGKRHLLREEAVACLLAATNPLGLLPLADYVAALRVESDRGCLYRDEGIIFEDGWQSVDKVLKPDTCEFYSSKPPLLSVLLAGLYWLLKMLFGWSLATQPDLVVRTTVVLVNVLPFALYLALLARLLERYSTSDWAKLIVFTAACFATLMTPFVITINNHTVATCFVLFALYPALQILEGRDTVGRWLLAGLCTGLVVCNELPALAFAAGLGFLLLLHRPGRTLAFFVPAAAFPLVLLVALNWVALGQLRPAYSEFGTIWYTYEGSHWRNPTGRTGIDFARNVESRAMYAVHVLVGHHGIFSLSPLWLLAFAAMLWQSAVWLGRRRARDSDVPLSPQAGPPLCLFPLTLAVSVVVIGFYLVKSDNYAGWSNGLRWLMWLTPLWLLCLVPVLERFSTSRWGRGLVYVLLIVSVLSVNFAPWNPWRHPWLYDWMEWMGWIRY